MDAKETVSKVDGGVKSAVKSVADKAPEMPVPSAMKPSGKQKGMAKLAALIIGGLVVLGGSAAAIMYTVVLPNNPNFVWSRIQSEAKDLFTGLSEVELSEDTYAIANFDDGATVKLEGSISGPQEVADIFSRGYLEVAIKDDLAALHAEATLGGKPVSADAVTRFDGETIEDLVFSVSDTQNVVSFLNELEPGSGDSLAAPLAAVNGKWYEVGQEYLSLLNEDAGSGYEGVCTDLGYESLVVSGSYLIAIQTAQTKLISRVVGSSDNGDDHGLLERVEKDDYSAERDGRDVFVYEVEISAADIGEIFIDYNNDVLDAAEESVPDNCKEIYENARLDFDKDDYTGSSEIEIVYDKQRREVSEVAISEDGADSELRLVISEEVDGMQDLALKFAGKTDADDFVINMKTENLGKYLGGDLGSDELVVDGSFTLEDGYKYDGTFKLTASGEEGVGGKSGISFGLAGVDEQGIEVDMSAVLVVESDEYGVPTLVKIDVSYGGEGVEEGSRVTLEAAGSFKASTSKTDEGLAVKIEEATLAGNIKDVSSEDPIDASWSLKVVNGVEGEIVLPEATGTLQDFLQEFQVLFGSGL